MQSRGREHQSLPTTSDPAAQAQARSLAIAAARSLADDKCEDVVALDLRGHSQVTDFFVIGTASSERQMRSVARHVADEAKKLGVSLFRTNMDEPGQNWIVVDFVDVVVHLFDAQTRGYYDLEMLWGDAQRIDWSRTPASAPGPGADTTAPATAGDKRTAKKPRSSPGADPAPAAVVGAGKPRRVAKKVARKVAKKAARKATKKTGSRPAPASTSRKKTAKKTARRKPPAA